MNFRDLAGSTPIHPKLVLSWTIACYSAFPFECNEAEHTNGPYQSTEALLRHFDNTFKERLGITVWAICMFHLVVFKWKCGIGLSLISDRVQERASKSRDGVNHS